MWEVEGRGGSRAFLCRALPSSGEVLRAAALSQKKPVWWVNTALERLWMQQGFPFLMLGWRTTTPCLSDLGAASSGLRAGCMLTRGHQALLMGGSSGAAVLRLQGPP